MRWWDMSVYEHENSMQLHMKVPVVVPVKARLTKDSLNVCYLASLKALQNYDGVTWNLNMTKRAKFHKLNLELNELFSQLFVAWIWIYKCLPPLWLAIFVIALLLGAISSWNHSENSRTGGEKSTMLAQTAQSSKTLDAATWKVHHFTTAVFMLTVKKQKRQHEVKHWILSKSLCCASMMKTPLISNQKQVVEGLMERRKALPSDEVSLQAMPLYWLQPVCNHWKQLNKQSLRYVLRTTCCRLWDRIGIGKTQMESVEVRQSGEQTQTISIVLSNWRKRVNKSQDFTPGQACFIAASPCGGTIYHGGYASSHGAQG